MREKKFKISQAMPFGLRMPPDIREWLDEKADKNENSVNSEILKVLKKAKASEQGVQQHEARA